MWQKLTWRATFITLLQSIVHNNKNVKYDIHEYMDVLKSSHRKNKFYSILPISFNMKTKIQL